MTTKRRLTDPGFREAIAFRPLRRRTALLSAIGLSIACPALAQQRRTVPVVNYLEQTWVAPAGRPADPIGVQQAILRAAGSLSWTTEPSQDGGLRARLVVRSKHTIWVRISWTGQTFSVRYDGSDQMSYWQPSPGRDYIHPNYNEWVQRLVKAIRSELERG